MKTKQMWVLCLLLLCGVVFTACDVVGETAADCFDDEIYDPVDELCYPAEEFEVHTEDDCFDDEIYDPVDEWCYPAEEFEVHAEDDCFDDEVYDPVDQFCYLEDYYMTADDCFDDEIYDPDDHMCYVAWDCAEDDACEDLDLGEELWGILGELVSLFGEDGYQGLDELGEDALITYEVNGDEIGNPQKNNFTDEDLIAYQNDTTTHREIWFYFTRLIPAEQRPFISKFSIFTDGEEEVFAAVFQDEADPTQWILAVDIVDAMNQQELTYSLIHEYGHLLTLNTTQVAIDPDLFYQQDDEDLFAQADAACSTYFPGEGCSLPTSYLNAFVADFWLDLLDELAEIESIPDDDAYYEALDDFYYQYEDQFVTDYAATNPGEDIAESWTAFVLQPKPAGDSVAEQKILFFYNYPQLVKLRSQIISHAYSRLRR